jgi:hypothetical protein
VKDRRGAIGRVTELAESDVAGVRRRQQARGPRVLLYDETGRAKTLPVGAEPAAGLLETAEAMIALTAPADPPPEDE